MSIDAEIMEAKFIIFEKSTNPHYEIHMGVASVSERLDFEILSTE